MKALCLTIFVVLASCASTPKGEEVLMEKITQDQQRTRYEQIPVNQGRPVFREVATYPQILPNGDIWMGGVILVNIGREEIKLYNIVNKYREGEKK